MVSLRVVGLFDIATNQGFPLMRESFDRTTIEKSSVQNGQIRYEHSIWCRWPDSNRHAVASGGF